MALFREVDVYGPEQRNLSVPQSEWNPFIFYTARLGIIGSLKLTCPGALLNEFSSTSPVNRSCQILSTFSHRFYPLSPFSIRDLLFKKKP